MKHKNFFIPTLPKIITFVLCFVIFYYLEIAIAGLLGIFWLYSYNRLPVPTGGDETPPNLLYTIQSEIRATTPAQFLLYVVLAILAYLCGCALVYFLNRPKLQKQAKEK